MCRYAMADYKPHYACFKCRKTFKRRLRGDLKRGWYKDDPKPAKCPQCEETMADMGLDFASPKMDDLKAWKHIENLYQSGVTFHSCGCSGPGYRPKDKKELINYLTRIRNTFLQHQSFWARREEDPKGEQNIRNDKNENGWFIYRLPSELQKGTRRNPEYDADGAQKYWNERILDLNQKIKALK